jgi:GH43 family beta-xylosidase
MQSLPGGKPGTEVLARGGNNTWAPDLMKVGDQYFLYYSAPATQPKSAIGLLVGKTLDPQSPDYGWTDRGAVVWSDGVEDSNDEVLPAVVVVKQRRIEAAAVHVRRIGPVALDCRARDEIVVEVAQ